ncbi:MAG TPA: hypothetical protein VII73_08870 [Caulobacteraceae bacterium]
MADLEFEDRIDRMFAQAPTFGDADLFALRLDERLNRGWTARRMLIGGLGLAGGLVGGAQVIGSGVISRFDEISAQSGRLLTQRLSEVAPFDLLPVGFAVDGQILWMSAALAAVAIGFAVARAVREI